MDKKTVNFEELQKTNREQCTRIVQEQISIIYQQLKQRGLQPDHIFLGTWDCLFDEIVPDMSDSGAAYVAELMGLDLSDYY